MELGKIIKMYREKNKISMEELAEKCDVSKSYISLLEAGKSPRSNTPIKPKLKTIFSLANGMGMEIDDLLKMMDSDQQVELPKPVAVRIPVVGRVRAGIPIETVEEIIGWEEITQKMAAEGEYFALRVNGDSMAPRILDGDIVIVKKQNCCDDGDIAIVLVNGSDATVKQVRKSDQGVTLIGFNPTVYAPHFYTGHDVEALPVEIIGKVVELRGKM